jgi:hypothetical protein
LARWRQLDAEIGPEQDVEAERLGAEEARGDRGVEERGEPESPALELNQVVVAGVKDRDDGWAPEHRRQRAQVVERQRVDQPDAAGLHRSWISERRSG